MLLLYGFRFEFAEGDDQINLFLFKYYKLACAGVKPTVLHYYYFVFPKLYDSCAGIPWYSVFVFLIFSVVCFFAIEILRFFASEYLKSETFLAAVVIVLVVLYLFAEHLASFTFTRLSILGVFVSWFYLIVKTSKPVALSEKLKYSIVAVIPFCISISLRVESVFVFLALLPIVFALGLFKRKVVATTGIVFIVIGIILYVFEKECIKGDVFYEKEKYVTSIVDAKFVRADIATSDLRYKIKREAALTWFTYDDSIGIDFLRQLTSGSMVSFEKVTHPENFQKFKFYAGYLSGIGGWYVVTVLLLIITSSVIQKKADLKMLLVFFYVIAFLFALCFFYKNEARVVSPVLSVLSFLLVLKIMATGIVTNTKTRAFIALTFIALLLVQAKLLTANNEEVEEFKRIQKQYTNNVLQIAKGKTLVIGMDKSYFFDQQPFDITTPSIPVLIIDNPYFGLNEQLGISGDAGFTEGYKLLIRNKEKYVFLISDARANFLNRYFNLIHGIDLSFRPLPHNFQHEGFLTFYTLQ